MSYLKIKKAYKTPGGWVYDCWLGKKLLGSVFNNTFNLNYPSYKKLVTSQIKNTLEKIGITQWNMEGTTR